MHTEAASENKMQVIKESLCDFVTTHVPNADLDAVDDVIVSYVFAAIEAVDSAPEDVYLHVNELVDIMSAYVTEFSKIDRDAVYIWLMDVMCGLCERRQKPFMDEAAKPDDKAVMKKDILSFQIPKQPPSNTSSRSNSTSEDDCKFSMSSVDELPTRNQIRDFESAVEASKEHLASLPPNTEPYQYAALIKFLTEMFPDASPIEVKHCVTIALGDVERALATLLHRRENGLALSAGALPARTMKQATADSAAVKNRIIERYSYVDRESGCKEHKPLAPKHAPKKMVRYRDNKIVSLKGERYTEVSKGEDEGVKKSNKKHHP